MTPRRNFKLNSRGYSLVELMTVVAIIGMLSTVAVTNYDYMVEKSRNSARLQAIAGIKVRLENYKSEFDMYPVAVGAHSSNLNDSYAVYKGPNYVPNIGGDLPREIYESEMSCLSTGSNDWHPAYIYLSNGTDYKIMSHCASSQYTSHIDPLRSPPSAENPCGTGSAGMVWAMSFYTPGARCW